MFGKRKKKNSDLSLLKVTLRNACDLEDQTGLKGWISTSRVRDILDIYSREDF